MSGPKLCPWLIASKCGVLTFHGRARFPQEVTPPTFLEADEYGFHREKVPDCTIVWQGESFTARFEGVEQAAVDVCGDALTLAFFERSEAAYRIDSFRWEAPGDFEDRLNIGGSPGELVSRSGVPVAVEVKATTTLEDLECTAKGWKLAAGPAELGPWMLTDRGGGAFDAVAEVVGGTPLVHASGPA